MDTPNVRKKTKPAFGFLRVRPETRKKVVQELERINKKEFGRKISLDRLVGLAITLIQPEHVKQLHDEALSNADRLELGYREYAAKHGPLSKDEFLGKLLQGEIRADGAMPAPHTVNAQEIHES